jgi:hypothetical protein
VHEDRDAVEIERKTGSVKQNIALKTKNKLGIQTNGKCNYISSKDKRLSCAFD